MLFALLLRCYSGRLIVLLFLCFVCVSAKPGEAENYVRDRDRKTSKNEINFIKL